MKPEQKKVHDMLLSTVSMLCKNALSFDSDLKVEGLIGITIDSKDVFIVHIDEKLQSAQPKDAQSQKEEFFDDSEESFTNQPKEKYSEAAHSNNKQGHDMLPQNQGSAFNGSGMNVSSHKGNAVNDNSMAVDSHKDFGPETSTSPRKRKRRRSSSKTSDITKFVEEDSESSSDAVVKDEQSDDEEVEFMNSEVRKPQKSTASTSQVQNRQMPADMSSGFVGFGDLSGNDSIDKGSQLSSNKSIMNSCAVFPTNMANKSAPNSKPEASWDSVGCAGLVPGLPVSRAMQEAFSAKWPPTPAGYHQNAAQEAGPSVDPIEAWARYFGAEDLQASRCRRSKNAMDKPYHCEKPGCTKSFYHVTNKYRHQKKAHRHNSY